MPDDLYATFDNYYHKAVALREKYSSRLRLLIGFETEYIRPESIDLIKSLLQKYAFDYCVGSIHHVLGIPIDYNFELWDKARRACGYTDESLYARYFDEQYEVLSQIQPLVVGHFDVIRLWAPDTNVSFRYWPSVWTKILRNIDTVVEYGGVFELNSSAFRKGLREAYPGCDIAQVLAYFSRLTVDYRSQRRQICPI
jgi:histidinol-phosphatase (PHP family)